LVLQVAQVAQVVRAVRAVLAMANVLISQTTLHSKHSKPV